MKKIVVVLLLLCLYATAACSESLSADEEGNAELEQGNIFNTDPLRPKRLLLHKSQIRHLFQEVGKMGYALVPLSVYLKDGRFKMDLGLCKGKKLHDKREDIAERDVKREMQRALRDRNRT